MGQEKEVKMKYLYSILVAATALLSVACIKNDLPYPTVELNIDQITGVGFTATTDAQQRIVTLKLDETTDIRNVRINDVAFGVVIHNTSLDKETLINQIKLSKPLTGTFDLRSPIYVTLSLYKDYDWTIQAEQTIERRFGVAGQVGSAVFDTENHIATAYVSKTADRSTVTISELKLGPAGITTYSPDIEALSKLDYSSPKPEKPTLGTPHFVDVTYHGRTEKWTLYVLPTDKSIELTGANAWSKVIWLDASGIAGETNGFRYRKAGESTWLEASDITTDGGNFSAKLAAEPETTYEVKAYCGDEETNVVTVTTDPVQQLPNSGFEDWCTVNDIVYPRSEGADDYWSTGNIGANIANEVLTDKTDPRPGSSGRYAAHLQSKYANLVGAGKFAAGNIFLGKYLANDGTNGLLTFGRSFTLRPTALRVWVKFTGGIVNYVGKYGPAGVIKNETPDNGAIYIALGTWTKEEYGVAPTSISDKNLAGTIVGTDDSPVVIATREVSTFFRPDGKDVVAYGEQAFIEDTSTWSNNTDGWVELTIPLKYNAKDIVPTNLIIVCSSSRWGDYFTGCSKSQMWLDDLELIYD